MRSRVTPLILSCFCDFLRPSVGWFLSVPLHYCDINIVQNFGATPPVMHAVVIVAQFSCIFVTGCGFNTLSSTLAPSVAAFVRRRSGTQLSFPQPLTEEASLALFTGAVTGLLQRFAAKNQQHGLPLILRGRSPRIR